MIYIAIHQNQLLNYYMINTTIYICKLLYEIYNYLPM